MNPIISPWFFYLISTASELKAFSVMFTVPLGALLFISIIFYMTINVTPENSVRIKTFIKKTFPIVCIGIMLCIFVPSEKACYQMMAASVVTSDNLEHLEEKSVDIVDYIVKSVNEMLAEPKMKEDY